MPKYSSQSFDYTPTLNRLNGNLGDVPTRRPVYPFAGSYGHLSLPSSKPEEKLNLSASFQREHSVNHFIIVQTVPKIKPRGLLLYKHKEV